MLLTDILERRAATDPNQPALVMRRGFRTLTLTYKETYDLSKRVAILLEKNGTNKGDVVLILSPNSPFWVSIFWGTILRGGIVVPLNIQSTSDIIERIVEQTGAKIIFVHPTLKSVVPAGLQVFNIELLLEDTADIKAEVFQKTEASENDIVEIIYTSGTTGEPKGVPLTHKNILSNVTAVAAVIPVLGSDRFLSVLPLSHVYEQIAGFLIPTKAGATIIYAHSPAAIRDLLQEFRVTKMAAVPEFLRIVMSKIEAKAKDAGKEQILKTLFSISNKIGIKPLQRLLFRSIHKTFGGYLHSISSGGAPLDPALESKWSALGIYILQGYGLTETSPVVATNTYDNHKIGSVGKALSGVEIKIAADKEVLVKGPNVFGGYFKNTEKTQEVFTPDGWFMTGDMGELDKEGFLYLKGRKKYMILDEGGQNVYPEDIESELSRDSRVKDSAVVGLALSGGKEELHAVLLLAEGTTPDEARAIIEHTNSQLASYQQIPDWSIWPKDDFPRSATRKVKKEAVLTWLREKELNELKPAPAETTLHPLHKILSEVTATDPSRITDDTNIVTELKLDSLLRVELVARIEEKFGVTINEATINTKTTVADLEKLIKTTSPTPKPQFSRWSTHRLATAIRNVVQMFLLLPFGRIWVKLRIEGAENLQNLPLPVIFAPNHTSYLDSFVLLMALPLPIQKRLAFAAARDVLYQQFRSIAPLLELLFLSFPFPRKEGENIRSGLEQTGKMLDQGYSVTIFPEGEMSKDGVLQTLKRGIGLVAVEMGATIVPVKILGAATVLPYGKLVPRRRSEVVVKFGKPLSFDRQISYDQAREEIEKALRAM